MAPIGLPCSSPKESGRLQWGSARQFVREAERKFVGEN